MSWVFSRQMESASLVFVDNPVGSGFSYLDDDIKVAHGVEEISSDLMEFLHQFLDDQPEFKVWFIGV